MNKQKRIFLQLVLIEFIDIKLSLMTCKNKFVTVK